MRNPATPVAAFQTPGSGASFDTFLTRLSPKTRAAVDKHVDGCEADAARGYGHVWKRFAEFFARLAPHAAEVSGASLRFFILDGKYRRQVFVLEDAKLGVLQIYMPDILAAAQERGLLGAPDGQSYPVVRGSGLRLEIEQFCADTKDVPDCCKPMLGWGRHAIRTTVSSLADEKPIRAIERLCELAAEVWVNAAPAATPVITPPA